MVYSDVYKDLNNAINATLVTARKIKQSPSDRDELVEQLTQYLWSRPGPIRDDLHLLATHRLNPTPATRAAVRDDLRGTIPLDADAAALVVSIIAPIGGLDDIPRGKHGREFRQMEQEVRQAYKAYTKAKAHLDVGDNYRIYYNSGLNALKQIFRIETRVHYRAEQDTTGEYLRDLKRTKLLGLLEMLNVRELVPDFKMRYKKSDDLTSSITDVTKVYREIDDTPRQGRTKARRVKPKKAEPSLDRVTAITTQFKKITGIRLR